MELILLVILVGSHAVTASQMARHGSAPLWWTATGYLLLVVTGGVFVGLYYSVPSLPVLLLYLVALTGPILVIPTVLLARTATAQTTTVKALPIALVGEGLGMVCGFVLVVWGLGVW